MERTACLGTCPIYSVTLYEDGVVEYKGRKFAPIGTKWRTIPPGEVARLIDAARRIQPWQCDPARIETDYPESIVTVSRPGWVRRLVHDHGDPCVPHEMRQLEADIDIAGGEPQLVPSVSELHP